MWWVGGGWEVGGEGGSCSHVPSTIFLGVFLCSMHKCTFLFPRICVCSRVPSFSFLLFPCSLKKMPLFPCSSKPPGGPLVMGKKDRAENLGEGINSVEYIFYCWKTV